VSTADSTILRLERTFHAPPEAVFDAWTHPEVLRRWWAADPDWSTPVAEVDLRVGGRYRLSMHPPDGGAAHTVAGTYLEVRRPERLVYTWAWEQEDGEMGPQTTVTVRFCAEDAERTTVVIEHAGLSGESRERHGAGWSACLASLERAVFPEVARRA